MIATLAAASLIAGPALADGPHGGHRKHAPPAGVTAPYLRDLFPSTYRPLPRVDTLITHGIVLDGAGHRIDDGDVLLRDGRIVATGHGLTAAGARVIDAKGRWVTPGIIDPHSHDGTYVVPQTSLDAEASDVSELSDPNAAGTWIVTAVNPQDPAFARALAGGVTTMQILPGSDPVFGGRSVIVHPIPATTAQGMAMPGAPQGLKMACGENPKTTDVELKRGPTSRQGEIAAPDIHYAALMAGRSFFADPRVAAASKGWAPGTAPWMQAIDGQTNLRQAVTLAKGTGATAIKVYANLPKELIAGITAEAHRQHLMVWAHSAVFPTRPADVIAAGVDVVSHACYLAYQLEPVMLKSYEDHTPFHDELLARTGDDPVIAGLYRDMLAHGTILDATGSLFVRYDAVRKAHPGRKPLRCTGATTIRLVRQAWRAGVPISTGTDSDGGVASAWPSVYDEIFFLVRDVGMPPLQAIRSATLVGAQAAGQARDMGSIAAGKLANFAVLANDPLQDIGNLRSIRLTVKRGHAYPRADYRSVSKDEMGDDED